MHKGLPVPQNAGFWEAVTKKEQGEQIPSIPQIAPWTHYRRRVLLFDN